MKTIAWNESRTMLMPGWLGRPSGGPASMPSTVAFGSW